MLEAGDWGSCPPKGDTTWLRSTAGMGESQPRIAQCPTFSGQALHIEMNFFPPILNYLKSFKGSKTA